MTRLTITDPGPNDVLFGKGRNINNHPGNIHFREFIVKNKARYILATRGEKSRVAMDVVMEWRALDPPGRFLTNVDDNEDDDDIHNSSNEDEDDDNNKCYDVGDKKAQGKVYQSLRSTKGAPKLIKPDSSKTARWWEFFKLYDPDYHPDKEDCAVCKICGRDVAVKDGSVGDLSNHIKNNHMVEYNGLVQQAEQELLDFQKLDAKKKKTDESLEDIENPKLIKLRASNHFEYGKYLIHFMRYDVQKHPAKNKMVRCNLCKKDVKMKRDCMALYRHLRHEHKKEYRKLNNESNGKQRSGAEALNPTSRKTSNNNIENNKAKTANQTGNESEKKEWFVSWEKTRNALNKVRRELKEESDEEMKEDFKSDIKRLRKRKAEFENLLGMED